MSRRPDPVASRRAILEAARGCFARSGYAGTSMHDIAKAAGVTQSLIHHHFGPKDALWSEVRTFAFTEHLNHQRALVDAGMTDPTQLRAALASYFRVLADNPEILRLVAWVELDRPQELVEEVRDLHARGVAAVEAGQAAGVLRADLPARFVVTAFMGLVRNWFEERNLIADESDPAEVARIDAAYLEAMWTVLSQGLLAPEPGQSMAADAP
ncbi:MAG: TetR/AcrR family transcriptional regulator [Myxococcales bacterium]|nr:TetR/AcrR family transcriptional regulator [Myxococcales bacterium]MCB9718606.1 TetR/AcrR family transcriptional regulator [Myxococcales bacterium]